jgi:hypothetical protein
MRTNMHGNGSNATTGAPGSANQATVSRTISTARPPRSGAGEALTHGTQGDTWPALADVGALALVVMSPRVRAVSRVLVDLGEVAAALRSGGGLDRRRLARCLDRAAGIIAEANGQLSEVIRYRAPPAAWQPHKARTQAEARP